MDVYIYIYIHTHTYTYIYAKYTTKNPSKCFISEFSSITLEQLREKHTLYYNG